MIRGKSKVKKEENKGEEELQEERIYNEKKGKHELTVKAEEGEIKKKETGMEVKKETCNFSEAQKHN